MAQENLVKAIVVVFGGRVMASRVEMSNPMYHLFLGLGSCTLGFTFYKNRGRGLFMEIFIKGWMINGSTFDLDFFG